ncbi:MAG: spondin domain-containing protein [Planctomycetota bacterium]
MHCSSTSPVLRRVSVENLAPEGGLYETPFWVAAHDGTFDIGTLGESAADFGGLEALAEEGDASGVSTRFQTANVGNDAVITAPAGFPGAPVFDPEEVASLDLTVDDTQASRYFSFASMVIPSNDAFIGNLNPQAYEIFDAGGSFLGPQSIVVYGNQIWDAGTEVNNPVGGAAFSAAGGTSSDENGLISQHLGLDDFVGTELVTGDNLESAFTALTPIARITLSLASNPSGPVDGEAPKSELVATPVTARADSHQIQVAYHDASGVDPTSIDTADLRILGPAARELDVLSVTTDAATGTTPRTVIATYEIAPSDGSFTHIHNGTYSVEFVEGEVRDVFAHEASASVLGDLDVDIPVRLQVIVESLAEEGGLGQTPFWIAAHDGNFEVARAGVSASEFGGLEELAEGGDVGPLVARFAADGNGNDSVITAPDGFPGAPVFEPGEVVTASFDVDDPEQSRYFSFASMIIPSNDAFIGNLNPRQYMLFNRFGDFQGPVTIEIYGDEIWDSGTEVNDPTGGAAFTTAGGTSVDENGVITQHAGLDDFLGAELPTGEALARAFQGISPIARITVSLYDNPSNPVDSAGPQASLETTDVEQSGIATHEVQVTYSDPSGVDPSTIGIDDIQVLGNFTQPLQVLSYTTDAPDGTTPSEVVATYQVAPLSGSGFSSTDNGVYNVVVAEDAVVDTLGNSIAETRVGDFYVLVGVRLQVQVENLSGLGGLGQTPFWVGFHEGNFEVARLGTAASEFPGLEALAEGGDVSGVVQSFADQSDGLDGVITAPDGFPGAPVFEPGETAFAEFEVLNTDVNRYFSFASMIIPSNDAFLGNLNPTQYELFDSRGIFRGAQSITLYGEDIWDAGTEVNDPLGGAAFVTSGGTSVDENGVIRSHAGLDDFIGAPLPTGEALGQAFFARTPVARITVSLVGNSSDPIDLDGPTATLSQADDVLQVGAESHQIEVTYDDPSGIDITRFGLDDLQVVGPLGQTLNVTGYSVDAADGTTPNTVTVTYTIATSDGEFTGRNNGRYEISIVQDSVGDTFSQGNERQTVGEFHVDVGIRIQVQIETLTEIGGLAQTPFWIGLHNGNFEIARAGQSAAGFDGLELIAEEGDPSQLAARFASENAGIDTVITSPEGFPGAPVFEPGESVTQIIEVTDTNINRYLSFASMVIPSNDAFLANLDPRGYELFDVHGNFQGAWSFTLTGADVYDAGTEVNDPAGGAAFSTEGGTSVDENGVVRSHAGLDDFIGTGLPTGSNLESAFNADTPIVRITITLVDPEATDCSGVVGACSVSSVGLHNERLALDVNNDASVSSIDALLLINFLNQYGSSATFVDEARSSGFFLDVSDDDVISPIDALLVISRLNDGANGEGEASAEGEAADQYFGSFPLDEFDPFAEDEEERFRF